MTDIDRRLEAVFGKYLAPDRELEWQSAKASLPAGSRISGTVVARYIFGLFVDIGVGFPALLPITQFDPPPRRRPVVIEDYPAVGSPVTGRSVAFDEERRQIGITQLDPHPFLDGHPGGKSGEAETGEAESQRGHC
jgi:ribosomal protein S1